MRLVEETKLVIEPVLPRIADGVGFAQAPFADEAGRVARLLQDPAT
jgi:hypothetical protein